MKKKWTNNLGIKILSLGLAALLWIIIVNVDDPAKTKTFSNVEVQLLNKEAITSENLVYEVLEGDHVEVKVKGNKKVIDSLKATDLIVTADLNDLNNHGSVQIFVQCNKYPNIEIDLGKVKYLKVSLENVKTARFIVEVVQKGNEEEGYSIDEMKAKPNIIKVSGAESQIDKIAKVVVEADVSNLNQDYKQKLEPKAYDKNNALIKSDKLTFSTNSIVVTASVLPTKMVPIDLTIKGEAAYGYRLTETEYEPKEIEIAAKQSVLDAITSIPIEIDIDGATENKEVEVSILDNLGKVKLADDSYQTLLANMKIEKLETKDITFSANDVVTKNLPSAMQFSYNQTSVPLTIQVMGLKAELDKLTIDSLTPHIDLTNLQIGTWEVEILFKENQDIEYLTKPKVSIVLADINATPTPTPEIIQTPAATSVPDVVLPTDVPQ